MNNPKIITIGQSTTTTSASRFAHMNDLVLHEADFDLFLDFETATPVFNATVWALVEDECNRRKLNVDDVFIYLRLKSQNETFIAIDHPTRDETYYIPFVLRHEEILQAIEAHAHDYIRALINAYGIGEYLATRQEI